MSEKDDFGYVLLLIILAILFCSGCQHTWFPEQQQPQEGITILEVQW
jgi:hypothetical protein